MKILFSVALFCSLLACVYADKGIVVSGTLIDGNGLPLVGIKVLVSGRSLYTNDEGYFCYEGLHPNKDLFIAVENENYKSIGKSLKHNNYNLKIVMASLTENVDSDIVSKLLPKEASYDWYCGSKSDQ